MKTRWERLSDEERWIQIVTREQWNSSHDYRAARHLHFPDYEQLFFFYSSLCSNHLLKKKKNTVLLSLNQNIIFFPT